MNPQIIWNGIMGGSQQQIMNYTTTYQTPTNDKRLNEINSAIQALIKAECWEFLNDYFDNLSVRVWRTNTDELIIHAKASLSEKNKISSRSRFIKTCKHLFPDVKLWKELE